MEVLTRPPAQVDARDAHGRTALHFAVAGGDEESAGWLVDGFQASLNVPNAAGRTAVQEAEGGVRAVLEAKLQAGEAAALRVAAELVEAEEREAQEGRRAASAKKQRQKPQRRPPARKVIAEAPSSSSEEGGGSDEEPEGGAARVASEEEENAEENEEVGGGEWETVGRRGGNGNAQAGAKSPPPHRRRQREQVKRRPREQQQQRKPPSPVPATPKASYAAMAGRVRESPPHVADVRYLQAGGGGGGAAGGKARGAAGPRHRAPGGPVPVAKAEVLEEALRASHPTAEDLGVGLEEVCAALTGRGLEALSVAQLDLLDAVLQRGQAHILQMRIGIARATEREATLEEVQRSLAGGL